MKGTALVTFGLGNISIGYEMKANPPSVSRMNWELFSRMILFGASREKLLFLNIKSIVIVTNHMSMRASLRLK